MRTKLTLGVAAVTLCLLPGVASAAQYLSCEQNGRAFFVVTKPDNSMVFADAGRCTGGPWGVWLRLIPATDTATAETDWEHDADAGRAVAILRKVRRHGVHWLQASNDVVATLGNTDGIKSTLAIRADHLPEHVTEQVWPAGAQ